MSHFAAALRPSVDDALEVWKGFLLDNRATPSPFEQRLIPFDRFPHLDREMPANMNRWLFLTTDVDTITNDDVEAYVVVKLCRLFVIGTIRVPHRRLWSGGKIRPEGGTFGPGAFGLPVWFWEYCALKAKQMGQALDTLSERQQRRIKDVPRNLPTDSSEVSTAMRLDVEQFGNAAYDIGAKTITVDLPPRRRR